MGNKKSPRPPVYAHHRLLLELTVINHGDEYAPRPGELDSIAKTFSDEGGSWYRLYHGSLDDMTHLRKVLKSAVEQGLVSKKPEWGA